MKFKRSKETLREDTVSVILGCWCYSVRSSRHECQYTAVSLMLGIEFRRIVQPNCILVNCIRHKLK